VVVQLDAVKLSPADQQQLKELVETLWIGRVRGAERERVMDDIRNIVGPQNLNRVLTVFEDFYDHSDGML
jgi:hypothetical protein